MSERVHIERPALRLTSPYQLDPTARSPPAPPLQVMAELLKSVPGASARTSHSMHSRTAMDRVWEEGLAGVEHPGQHHYHHHHHKGHHHTETPAGEVPAALGQPLSEEHNNGKPGQGNGAEH